MSVACLPLRSPEASPDAVALIEYFRRLRQKNSVIHGIASSFEGKALDAKGRVSHPFDLPEWAGLELLAGEKPLAQARG